MIRKYFIYLYLLFAIVSFPVFAEDDEKYIEQFGSSEKTFVDAGFVFIDGKYIQPPYIVQRKGLSVYVNNTKVQDTPVWWLNRRKILELDLNKDPGVPEDASENSRFEDFKIKIGNWEIYHTSLKYHYLYKHYPEEVAKKKLFEYYKSLCFIEKVEMLNENTLFIHEKNGRKYGVGIDRPLPVPSEEDGLNSVEFHRKNYIERFKVNDTYFFFTNPSHELSFGSKWTAERLSVIVEILKSKRTYDEKVDLMNKIKFPMEKRLKQIDPLFTSFEVSDDLYNRLNKLIDEIAERYHIKPLKMKDILE